MRHLDAGLWLLFWLHVAMALLALVDWDFTQLVASLTVLLLVDALGREEQRRIAAEERFQMFMFRRRR